MGGHAGERYIYLWHCFCTKIRTEKDLHIPKRVNANIVKFLTVFTKQAWLSVRGTAGFAERHSVNRAFPWLLKEMRAVPRLMKHSRVCKGLCCSAWPVLFNEDMKMSFSVPCVITAFKIGKSSFYVGVLKDLLHPLTPFPLWKKTMSLGALLLHLLLQVWNHPDEADDRTQNCFSVFKRQLLARRKYLLAVTGDKKNLWSTRQ